MFRVRREECQGCLELQVSQAGGACTGGRRRRRGHAARIAGRGVSIFAPELDFRPRRQAQAARLRSARSGQGVPAALAPCLWIWSSAAHAPPDALQHGGALLSPPPGFAAAGAPRRTGQFSATASARLPFFLRQRGDQASGRCRTGTTTIQVCRLSVFGCSSPARQAVLNRPPYADLLDDADASGGRHWLRVAFGAPVALLSSSMQSGRKAFPRASALKTAKRQSAYPSAPTPSPPATKS